MVWDKNSIQAKLKKLHKEGENLSYNALAKKMQSLVSAAAYHFGSYRIAVEKSGLDYAEIARRPRWTRAAIIKLIKETKRQGNDLHWSAVIQRRDELGKAAFASLQPRLFGSWDRALHAAGLDADAINRYRKWNRDTIISELRARHRDGGEINSGALQKDDPGLHAAAVRHFDNYDLALRAAKLDPDKVRRRRNWSQSEVIRELKVLKKANHRLTDSAVRREHAALYGASVRLFGSFSNARVAAGIRI